VRRRIQPPLGGPATRGLFLASSLLHVRLLLGATAKMPRHRTLVTIGARDGDGAFSTMTRGGGGQRDGIRVVAHAERGWMVERDTLRRTEGAADWRCGKRASAD
jgi:hypothetical protein